MIRPPSCLGTKTLSLPDWIQTVCAVLTLCLAVFILDSERKAKLRDGLRAVTSTLATIFAYSLLTLFICVYAQEVILFARSQEPMQRYEVVNLILNVVGICWLLWAGVFLYRNLGKGTKAQE